jgi:hypothetical protein
MSATYQEAIRKPGGQMIAPDHGDARQGSTATGAPAQAATEQAMAQANQTALENNTPGTGPDIAAAASNGNGSVPPGNGYPPPEHEPSTSPGGLGRGHPVRELVAARDELEPAARGPTGRPQKGLKADAKEQEKAQKEQLSGGKAKGAAAKGARADRKLGPSGQHRRAARRRGRRGPAQGRVDNMTRRDDTDVLQGHFCYIDYSNAEAQEGRQAQLAPKGSALAEQGFEPGLGSADYGVYLSPAPSTRTATRSRRPCCCATSTPRRSSCPTRRCARPRQAGGAS